MGPKIVRVADKPGGLLRPDPMMAGPWRGNYLAETVGTDTVDGKPCYQVEVTQDGESAKQVHCFDQQSGFLVYMSVAAAKNSGFRIKLGDYRTAGNVKLPFRMETEAMGNTMRVEADDVKLNEKLPPETFDPPDEILALLKRKQRPEIKEAEEDPNRPRLQRKRR